MKSRASSPGPPTIVPNGVGRARSPCSGTRPSSSPSGPFIARGDRELLGERGGPPQQRDPAPGEPGGEHDPSMHHRQYHIRGRYAGAQATAGRRARLRGHNRRMLLKSAGATLCGLALMAATALSQTPVPRAACARRDSAPQAPTFRAAVTLVTTDVITRDSRRTLSADLTKDELHGARRRRAADDHVVLARARRPHVHVARGAGADGAGGDHPADDAPRGRWRIRPAACCSSSSTTCTSSPNTRRTCASCSSTLVDTLVHDGRSRGGGVERTFVDRNPADLRSQAGRRRGVEDSRIGDDAGRDVQDARNVAGPGRHPAACADGVLCRVQHPRATWSRSRTSARPSSTSAPATTSIRSPRRAAAAIAFKAGASPSRTRFLYDEENPYLPPAGA